MRNPKNNGNFVRNSLFYVILALGFLGLFYWVTGPTQTTTTKTTTTSQFVTDLKDDKIKKITVQPGAGVYCEFNHPGGKHRPKVLRSALGIVILEPKEADWAQSGWIYSVVTAYETHRTQGTLLGRL